MKNIFGKLFGEKSANKINPLTTWADDLADLDELDALRMSTQQLTQILGQQAGQIDKPAEIGTQEQLDLIILLETLNAPRLETLATQYVSIENIRPELEKNIGETCYNYCRQVYICHLKIIEKVIDPNKFTLVDGMNIKLIARAINAAANMIKWRLFNQSNPPTNVWLQLYMLYRVASQQDLLNQSTDLFVNSPNTTLSASFVQVFMLGQLQQSNMLRHHIEISTRIMKSLLTTAHISKVHTPEQYLFYIDLEKDAGAKRMRKVENIERCRFWELDELEKLITVAMNVSDRDEVPPNLAHIKIDNVKRLNETLHILFEEWTRTDYLRQRRKEPRFAASKTARVNAGIINICNQIQQANQINSGLKLSRDSKSFDDRLLAHTVLRQTSNISINSNTLDTWIVTDESKNGLGIRVNKYSNILVRPDKLISLMMDDDPSQVLIGMIRGVKPTSGNQIKVGVEILSRHPTWIQLRPIDDNEMFPNTHSGMSEQYKSNTVNIGVFSGIYLPIEAGLADISMLILPKLHFKPNSNFAANIAGIPKSVKFGVPVESRDDWVKVAFPF
jgi:cyclic-di-GMP-binding protein